MGRTRGCLWLAAGLAVAALAGIVAFITLSNAAGAPGQETGARGPAVPVVVAVRPVEVRAQLSEEDLVVREVPVETVPEGAVSQLEDAVGKVTMTELVPGEIVLAQRLVDPNVISGDGRKALILAEEEVLMAFPVSDTMIKSGVLKPGDHVDLLFTLNFPTDRGIGGEPGDNEEPFTFNLLQNLTIAALVGGQTTTGGATEGTPQAILLTIDPQDALVLKYVKDAGGILDIVLRAPGAEQPFEVDPVDVDLMIDRYQIPAEVGR